jgi:hypothetical protein
MSSLIVIRVVPQTPVDPDTFTGYLNPAGLGPLQITAYDLSFNSPTTGQNVGAATFIAPSTLPSPTKPIPIVPHVPAPAVVTPIQP